MIELWTELAGKAALTLDEAQDAKLSRYLELLVEANEKMNLTRIVDVDSARVQHIGDALTVLPYLPKGEHKLADVGSGGGVPGIPLAIARPDASITLIESTKKKAAFLKRAASELGLPNVKVLDLRAEDVGNGPLRETFDIAIARAVASLDWLAEWCLPLVKKKGTMLAMKGQKIVEELPRRRAHDSTVGRNARGGASGGAAGVGSSGNRFNLENRNDRSTLSPARYRDQGKSNRRIEFATFSLFGCSHKRGEHREIIWEQSYESWPICACCNFVWGDWLLGEG